MSAPDPYPPSSRTRAIALRVLVACLVLAIGVLVMLGMQRGAEQDTATPSTFDIPELDVAPGERAPAGQRSPKVRLPAALEASAKLGRWADRVSARTDIPARALRSYAAAELRLRQAAPDCRLSWTTLAGVGMAESLHGQHDGAALTEDGTPSAPIVGPPLDGSPGVKAIRDTDNGRLDGDRRWDRAVGPMQFLPVTWAQWSVRATGDNRPADPQSLDDAALAAGRYLCDAGGNLASPRGWWRAVLTYNNSADYGREVFSNADAYAKASLRA